MCTPGIQVVTGGYGGEKVTAGHQLLDREKLAKPSRSVTWRGLLAGHASVISRPKAGNVSLIAPGPHLDRRREARQIQRRRL